MSVVIRDFEVMPSSEPPAPKPAEEKPGAKPDASSPEMRRAIERHKERIAERALRVRAY